jgi:CheY-like chemotaxis protein
MYTPDNSSYRILVADDEPHIRQILRFTLERAGYQVFTADGEALARPEIKPSLVLLDVMPRMDGYEVCRKCDGLSSTVPVIMLSARGDQRDRVAARWAPTTTSSNRTRTKLLLRVRTCSVEHPPEEANAHGPAVAPPSSGDDRAHRAESRMRSSIDIDNFKGQRLRLSQGREIMCIADIIGTVRRWAARRTLSATLAATTS